MLFTCCSTENYGTLSKNLRLGPCATLKQFVMNHACDMNLGDAPSNMSSAVRSYDPKAGGTS